jgi:hypothetical protein
VSDAVAGLENVVMHVATPAVRDWVPQPVMVVPPFLKLTVPVGVTPPPVTVAVRVVVAPAVVGDGDGSSVVVEVPALTVSEVVVDVEVV